MRVVNPGRGELGDRVERAASLFARLRGLLSRTALDPGEGLLLTPCRAVHMHGMRFPIDVAFLDRAGRIVALYEGLAPGQRTRWHWRAHAALELPAGTLRATGTALGDHLTLEEAS
jgi:uncharacterized membrane protein (UPF0127 family)